MATFHTSPAGELRANKGRDWALDRDVEPLTNRVLYFCLITRGEEGEVRITKQHFRWREREVLLRACCVDSLSSLSRQPSREQQRDTHSSTLLKLSKPRLSASSAWRHDGSSDKQKKHSFGIWYVKVYYRFFFFFYLCVRARACV